MRYIKKFNEGLDLKDFNLESAMSDIRAEFSEERVCEMFDNEVLEWVDSNWADEADSEYDWYVDHNNGEAQDAIVTQIIDWYKSKSGINLNQDIDKYSELFDAIKEEYSALSF